MAEQTTTAGWYADATKPGRERWWDGATWTARVREDGVEGVAWLAHEATLPVVSIVDGDIVIDLTGTDETVASADDRLIIDLTASDHVGAPTAAAGAFAPSRFVPPRITTFRPVVRVHPRLRVLPTTYTPPGTSTAPIASTTTTRRGMRFRRVAAVAAVIVLVLGVAATSAAIIESRTRGSEPLPLPVGQRTYRDATAGFTLQHPRQWRVLDTTQGTGVTFVIGAAGAATDDGNTITVDVGSEAAELPLLEDLASDVTDRFRTDRPGITFESATRARLAGGAAYRLELSDRDAAPPVRIVEYVGATADGRPLTVTMTVHDEGTAPSGAQLRTFVRNIRAT
jgi:hypothetical protein